MSVDDRIAHPERENRRRSMRRLPLVMVLFLAWALCPTTALAQPSCSFVLGFAELRDTLGHELVGECLEDQRNTATGEGRQRSTKGELIWRPSDSATLFTDGTTTWISGPYGLQTRAADQRFDWEVPTAPVAAPPAASGPPPAATTPAAPTLDPALASRCFRISSELIVEHSAGVSPDVVGRAYGALQKFCHEAAVEHGVKGVDCFEWAFRRALAGNRVGDSDSGGRAAFALFNGCVGAR
jgi:hypothetical protein